MDEADRLLNLDFEEELNTIISLLPKERSTFLFSATMTSKVGKLQRASLRNPIQVKVSSKYDTVSTLIQNYLFIPFKHKQCYLTYLLTELSGNTAIIFTSTCDTSQKLTIMLRNLGLKAICLHGNLTQPQRLGALNGFKSRAHNILIATDVASRGLDIPNVDLIVNYDVPANSKDYIHRVGRTARAGNSGRAITLVTQYDVELYQRIEKLINLKLEAYPAEEDLVFTLGERVSKALKLAQAEMKEANSKDKKRPKTPGDYRDTEAHEQVHYKKAKFDDSDGKGKAPMRGGGRGGGRGRGGRGGRGGGRGRGGNRGR